MALDTSGYSYNCKGKFAEIFALGSNFITEQAIKRKYQGYIYASVYNFSNKVYAIEGMSATGYASGYAFSAPNTGAFYPDLLGGKGQYYRTNPTYPHPYMVCVTYKRFSEIDIDVSQWRELGVSAQTGGQVWGYTNRVIIPDAMRDYIYITSINVMDNSADGSYSKTNPRSLLANYDICTPIDIRQCKQVTASGSINDNSSTGQLMISMRAMLYPYAATSSSPFDSSTAYFDILAPMSRAMGDPYTDAIHVVGLNASNNQICRACLFPSVTALTKTLNLWGLPYTTDLNAAYYDNVSDLPDYYPDGIPDNPTGGGDGDGDNFSDPIDFPSAPYSPASLGGYLTLVQSPSELAGLTTVLWKPVIRDLSDALKVYFNTDNLTNSVLSIMYYPLDLAAMSLGLTHSNNIRIAWSTDNISADIMANKVSHEIDAGYYDVSEYYGSFLDYSPYTTIDIWLPYIGYKPLDVDAVMGKKISVKYFVDFVDGLATAVIFADGQPINNYTGQLGIDLAVTGRDNAAKIRQSIDAVMTSVTGVNKAVGGVMQGAAQAYAGNVGGAVGSVSGIPQAAAGVGAAAMQTAFQQPSTVVYGTAGGENWLSMPQKCHLKITRTVAASPASYIDEMGYPTTYTNTVSKFTGYLKCAAVFGDFTGIPADDADEIQALLNSGVHISGGAFE